MSLRLRMYNIPINKTEQQLLQEFNSVTSNTATPVTLQLVMKNDTEHAGYAFLDFETQTDYDNFVGYYPKLRHDLVIYKKHNG